MTSMLNAIDGVSCAEPEGAFYCYRTCRGCWVAPSGASGALLTELAEILLESIKIAVVPGEAFARRATFD